MPKGFSWAGRLPVPGGRAVSGRPALALAPVLPLVASAGILGRGAACRDPNAAGLP